MHSRVDDTLSQEQIDTIATHFDEIFAQMDFLQTLFIKERKATGWKLSKEARVFSEKMVEAAKNESHLLSPSINLDAYARDVVLAKQMHAMHSRCMNLARQVKDTYMRAQVEAAEQGLYLYKQFKAASDAGVGGASVIAGLRQYLPRAGKKSKKVKKEVIDEAK